jgi:hypothetical protein
VRVLGDGDSMRLSVYDLISSCSCQQNPRETYSNLMRLQSTELRCLEVEPRLFAGRGQQYTPTVPMFNVLRLLNIVLAGSRIPISRKLYLLGSTDVPMKSYTEIEIISRLQTVFAHLNPIPQFIIDGGRYRIDLYLSKVAIAIECDENGHEGYDHCKELERTSEITRLLNCRWIRFTPDAADFDYDKLLHEIVVTVHEELMHRVMQRGQINICTTVTVAA